MTIGLEHLAQGDENSSLMQKVLCTVCIKGNLYLIRLCKNLEWEGIFINLHNVSEQCTLCVIGLINKADVHAKYPQLKILELSFTFAVLLKCTGNLLKFQSCVWFFFGIGI